MGYLVWFLVSFVLIYLLYYVLFINKSKRKEKVPSEAQLLISMYKLDTKKFSYRKFLKIVGLVTAFDVSIVSTIVGNVNGFIWQILFGFVVVIPVAVISFILLGKYYEKKQLKDNTKELEKEKKYLDKQKEKKNKKKMKGKKKNG